MPEQLFCQKCRRTMSDVKFYTYKDGSKCELCKNCLTMHINTYEPDTYLWLLEKFDVPYIESEWKIRREKEFEKAYDKATKAGARDPKKAAYDMTRGNGVVFGKYLSQMKLRQWKEYTWDDTERLKREVEEKAKFCGDGAAQEAMQSKIEAIKEAYKNGEISEAQYMTYAEVNPVEEENKSLEDQFLNGGNAITGEQFSNTQGSPYPSNDHPFEEVKLKDVGSDLTEEDKIYLALKWGQLYSAADWVALEKLYNEFMQSFEIQGAARLDTLKMICKTSLKMNQAIDVGDIDSYQKLSRVYDAMMKSAKFTEAQRKEENAGNFDCVGQICLFAESLKGGGKIPRHKIDTPRDIVDEVIMKLKQYYVDLLKNDSTIGQQLENLIKKKEQMRQKKEDEAKAKALGLEEYQLTDTDIIVSKEEEEKQRQQDKEFMELLSEEGSFE